MSKVNRYGTMGSLVLATDGLLKVYPGMELFVRVSGYDAALAREAALREELIKLRESYESMRDRKNSIVALQQRLTDAEKRVAELDSAAREMLRIAGIANQGSNAYNRAIINLNSALKTAEGEGS